MKLYFTLTSMLILFIVLGAVFFALGLYHLDYSLISIACLFAVAAFLLRLEMKAHAFTPFS